MYEVRCKNPERHPEFISGSPGKILLYPRSKRGFFMFVIFQTLKVVYMIRLAISIMTIIGVLWMISLFAGYTIVVPISKYKPHEKVLQKRDTINPLKHMDFNNGNWTVYLVMNQNDKKNLNLQSIKSNCVWTNNIDLLNQMKDTWRFTYSGGDIATAESAIYFFNNGKLRFKSGIVFDNGREGLQSNEYGWLEAINKNELSHLCNKFKQTYWPIKFL